MTGEAIRGREGCKDGDRHLGLDCGSLSERGSERGDVAALSFLLFTFSINLIHSGDSGPYERFALNKDSRIDFDSRLSNLRLFLRCSSSATLSASLPPSAVIFLCWPRLVVWLGDEGVTAVNRESLTDRPQVPLSRVSRLPPSFFTHLQACQIYFARVHLN